jgi:hypothetical protein
VRKSTKKVRAKPPAKKRTTVDDRLVAAREEGHLAGVVQGEAQANSLGDAYAVSLNAKLHGVVSQLQGVAAKLANASNTLAEIIRFNTPTPRQPNWVDRFDFREEPEEQTTHRQRLDVQKGRGL